PDAPRPLVGRGGGGEKKRGGEGEGSRSARRSRHQATLKRLSPSNMLPAHGGVRHHMTATTANRGLRLFGRDIKLEGVFALVGLAVVWQVVSFFTPDYLFPSVPQIATRFVHVFS